MAYISDNDRAFTRFVEEDVMQWNRQSLLTYLNCKHAILDGDAKNTEGNIDQACMIDDRVCDWMERGYEMPSVTMIVRMREWMR